MSLNKRASLLILPIILLSYCLAAIGVYKQQYDSLRDLEQSKLDNQLSQLQSAFTQYSHFVDAYLLSLLEGDVLVNFIRSPSNSYRERSLSKHLESAIRRYQFDDLDLASLSIISPNKGVLFYVENSTDPFAKIRPEQTSLAERLYRERKFQAWEHLHDDKSCLIQQAVSIDSRTLIAPLATQMDHSLQIVVAINPSKYMKLLHQIESYYHTSAVYTHQQDLMNDENTPLSSHINLKDNHYLSITPSANHLEGLLNRLKYKLIFFVTLGATLTFLLLQLLIRRYITNPITQLDKQLIEVMDQQRQNINPPLSKDEVGRLGRRFYELYAQLNQAYQLSRQQSLTDSLTQLPNRAAFYKNSTAAINNISNEADNIYFIYIDLDNFKFVNDKYGHETGDELLKEVATKLQNVTRLTTEQFSLKEQPYLARLSGDEFIARYQAKGDIHLEHFINNLLDIFSRGFLFGKGSFPITASVGIASYPDDGHCISELVSNADLAMYEAKRSGKNQHTRYSSELAKQTREAKDIESSLKKLDCDKEFTLHYMPIFDTDGNVKSCEALLRWTSPTLGQVSPALFIPIAESTGSFEKIDLWVIEQTFRDLPKLQRILGENINVSLNLSSAEINSDHFIKQLSNLIDQHQITASSFILEITETFAITQNENVTNWLNKIRQKGFSIAIDDFGTGYTSLMQMVDYPADIIKFDKELIDRTAQMNKYSLIKALIDLCHLQNIKVVAEGIENNQQHELLQAANCDYLQGFLLAKPMSLVDLENWKNKQNLHVVSAST